MEKKEKKGKIKSYLLALAGTIIAILLDQYTKYLAVLHLKGKTSFVLIDGVFELQYLENKGAAFGLMQNRQYIFAIGAVVLILAIIFLYGRFPHTSRFYPLRVCSVLLCSGAIGNLIDRIRLNYVIDFFYFRWIDFPIFNVADCYVVIACILLILLVLFYYKDEEFNFLDLKIGARKGRK